MNRTTRRIVACLTGAVITVAGFAVAPAISPITASIPGVSSLMTGSANAEVSRTTAINSGRNYCQRTINVQSYCYYDRDYLTTYHRVIDYYYYITATYYCYMRVYVYRTNGYAGSHRNLECYSDYPYS